METETEAYKTTVAIKRYSTLASEKSRTITTEIKMLIQILEQCEKEFTEKKDVAIGVGFIMLNSLEISATLDVLHSKAKKILAKADKG
jgi:hypothetical protein